MKNFFSIVIIQLFSFYYLNDAFRMETQRLLYPDEVNNAIKLYLNKKYLEVVRLANDTVDSKSIVDRPTKKPIDEVLLALNGIKENDKEAAVKFVNDYLNEPGSEILKAAPIDWNNAPEVLNKLQSKELRNFTKALNDIWLDLIRKVDENVILTSHLPMLHPFVVPGGRFKEIYYWDTYWTLEGLLVCDMHQTARMILENFINFITLYGFIPNGSRVYYLNRSQPPYFSKMVMAYYEYSLNSKNLSQAEKDEIKNFVLEIALPAIEKEYNYFMREKTVKIVKDGTEYEFNLFKVNTNEPRPESYNEDVETASHVSTESEKAQIYADLASAAESGYDFSSRWFKDPYILETIQTTNIIPVDLNAIMYNIEYILSELYNLKGDAATAEIYAQKSATRRAAINDVLWSSRRNSWSDYNIAENKLNDEEFYVFGLAPLWFDIEPPGKSIKEVIKANYDAYTKYDGGIPVSFVNSTQQWDLPNVWAPNQHSVIIMLLKHDRELSLRLARNFFNSVYEGWRKDNSIYEKYDAVHPGERGQGGEYQVQSGFGWSNGVIFKLIEIFKDELMI